MSRTLGHASAGFTADRYARDRDDAAAEAAEVVGRAIEGSHVWLVGSVGETRRGRDHRPLPFAVVQLVAGTGFEPVTSGL